MSPVSDETHDVEGGSRKSDSVNAALSGILDSIDAAVIVVDRVCKVTRFNRAAAKALSIAPSDVGRHLCDIRALAEATDLANLCEQVIADGTPCRREIRIGDRWFIVQLAPYSPSDRHVGSAVLTFANVTAFRASIGQAVYEREYTKAILNTVIDPLVVLDSNLRVQSGNRAFYAMMGVSREQTQGVPLGNLGNPDWKSSDIWSKLRATLSGKSEFQSVEVQRDFSIGLRTVLLNARRLSLNDSAGNLLVLTFHDITERKEAENALRESEQRFRQLADAMPQIVWSARVDGYIDYYNQRWFEFTGFPRGEFGQSSFERILHPDDVQRGADTYFDCIREGTPFQIEYRFKDRTRGGYRWFMGRALPVRNEQGEIVKWFGTCTDIDEVKRSEEELHNAGRRKDEFLATLAHELRNPLAPIRNSLHILRTAEGSGIAVERVYEMMERQVGHMIRLVDDLLELSRISRGTIELKKERVELATVINHAVEISGPSVEAGGHHLAISVPSESIIIDGDPVRLSQVFANLLNNAAKYTQNSGNITLSARCEDQTAIVSIRDTGIGIPRDMLARVFDMFAQVDNVLHGSQDGLGIGLSLVKALVAMHGGSVEAYSNGLGHGSEFLVRLPLAEQQCLGAKSTAPKDGHNFLPARRILVVDDNRDAADSLSMLLESLGADVNVAYDGQSALEALRTCRPSVILLDLGMPSPDGYEVAKRVRQDPQFRNLVLIALSGWGQAEDRRRTQEAGFSYHLVKPVDLDALRSLLISLDGEKTAGAPPPEVI